TVSIKLNPILGTNDSIYASSIAYGGLLSLSNIAATPLTAGSTFKLFVASNYSGVFTAVTPLIPGPGLAWYTNNLPVDGTLSIIYTPGDTWLGVVNGNWDTSTLNWSTSGVAAAYTQGDTVTFDDAVVGTASVILTTALAPAGITFNNASSNY